MISLDHNDNNVIFNNDNPQESPLTSPAQSPRPSVDGNLRGTDPEVSGSTELAGGTPDPPAPRATSGSSPEPVNTDERNDDLVPKQNDTALDATPASSPLSTLDDEIVPATQPTQNGSSQDTGLPANSPDGSSPFNAAPPASNDHDEPSSAGEAASSPGADTVVDSTSTKSAESNAGKTVSETPNGAATAQVNGTTPSDSATKTGTLKLATVLELNSHLIKLCVEFQTFNAIQCTEFQEYSNRLQSNLTWLASYAESGNHPHSLPSLTPPPPVSSVFHAAHRALPHLSLTQSQETYAKIVAIYAKLPSVFSADIERFQQLNKINGLHNGLPDLDKLLMPGVKRDRAQMESPLNVIDVFSEGVGANKRLDTGQHKSSTDPSPYPRLEPLTGHGPLGPSAETPIQTSPTSFFSPAPPNHSPTASRIGHFPAPGLSHPPQPSLLTNLPDLNPLQSLAQMSPINDHRMQDSQPLGLGVPGNVASSPMGGASVSQTARNSRMHSQVPGMHALHQQPQQMGVPQHSPTNTGPPSSGPLDGHGGGGGQGTPQQQVMLAQAIQALRDPSSSPVAQHLYKTIPNFGNLPPQQRVHHFQALQNSIQANQQRQAQAQALATQQRQQAAGMGIQRPPTGTNGSTRGLSSPGTPGGINLQPGDGRASNSPRAAPAPSPRMASAQHGNFGAMGYGAGPSNLSPTHMSTQPHVPSTLRPPSSSGNPPKPILNPQLRGPLTPQQQQQLQQLQQQQGLGGAGPGTPGFPGNMSNITPQQKQQYMFLQQMRAGMGTGATAVAGGTGMGPGGYAATQQGYAASDKMRNNQQVSQQQLQMMAMGINMDANQMQQLQSQPQQQGTPRPSSALSSTPRPGSRSGMRNGSQMSPDGNVPSSVNPQLLQSPSAQMNSPYGSMVGSSPQPDSNGNMQYRSQQQQQRPVNNSTPSSINPQMYIQQQQLQQQQQQQQTQAWNAQRSTSGGYPNFGGGDGGRAGLNNWQGGGMNATSPTLGAGAFQHLNPSIDMGTLLSDSNPPPQSQQDFGVDPSALFNNWTTQ